MARLIVDQEEGILSGEKKEVSVLFTDVRNYTTLSEGLSPETIVGVLNELFSMTGKIIGRRGGSIIDFVGDAVLAVFGAPHENPQHARDAVLSAIAVTRPCPPQRRSKHLCATAGYRSAENLGIIDQHGYIAQVVDRCQEADRKRRNPQQKARRWIVEVSDSQP